MPGRGELRGGVATSLATIRLSPESAEEDGLKTVLIETLHELASKPGMTGAHPLLTDTPKTSAPTTEQQIRGADGAADWIVLLSGYEPETLQEVISNWFSAPASRLAGAREKSTTGRYRLSFTMTSHDTAGT